MREAIHDYLLERPSGASIGELVDLIFTRPGSDPEMGQRFLEVLLGNDKRFAFDAEQWRWRVTVHDCLAEPLETATFVVVDLETTGGGPGRGDSIIEIGAVKVAGGRVVDTFQTLIDPRRSLPRFITRLTGISDDMLAGRPAVAEALPAFADFAGEAVMVAHNARFDRAFLDAAWREILGAPVTRNFLCTLRLARRLLPTLRKRSLDALAGHYGIPCVDRHRALGDARMTAEVLFHFLEALPRRGVLRVAEALDFQGLASDGRRFFCMLPRSAVATLPRRPGIYRFTGESGELLYIGKATDLQQRVSSYLTNSAGHSRKTLDLIRHIRAVSVEETGSELEASLLEAEQIRAHQPPYNVLRKHLPRIAYLKLTVADRHPRLSIAARPSGRRARFFGPFRSRAHADRALDSLVRAFRLRTCAGRLDPAPAVAPCFQGQIGNCTMPCNATAATDAYAAQVRDFTAFFDEDGDAVFQLLEQRRDELSDGLLFESAARVQRDIDLLRHLRKRRQQMSWIVERHNFAVVQPTGDGGFAVYLVVHGRLVDRRRLDEETDLAELVELVADHLATARPRGLAPEEVDGTTILAAWLRDRGEADGYVIRIDAPDGAGDGESAAERLPEWAAALRTLLAGRDSDHRAAR
jgi:DNA polymerase III subunit epsilon